MRGGSAVLLPIMLRHAARRQQLRSLSQVRWWWAVETIARSSPHTRSCSSSSSSSSSRVHVGGKPPTGDDVTHECLEDFGRPAAAVLQNTHYARLKSATPEEFASALQTRGDRSSPSRDVNYDTRRWNQHESPWRHWRHLLSVPYSSTLQRLFMPDLLVVGCSATAITYYNTVLVPAAYHGTAAAHGAVRSNVATWSAVSLPVLPFTISSMALGLLVAFRTNQSTSRYHEARLIWGDLVNSVRDLARQINVWIPRVGERNRLTPTPTDDGSSGGHACTATADTDTNCVRRLYWRSAEHQRIGQLLKAFPVALNFHLCDDGGHRTMTPTQLAADGAIEAEFYAEMLDVWGGDADNPDFRRIVTAFRTADDHAPLAVLMKLSEALQRHQVDPVFEREMDRQVKRLTAVLGGCERLLRTPIPPSFTRHTSRSLTLWCNLLPFALWPETGWATVPVSLMVTFVLLGIEDIGVQIENPFHNLPLRQYQTAVHASVDALLTDPR